MDKKTYQLKSLEKYINLFTWKSETMELPLNPEFYLTENGTLGYDLKHNKWVHGTFTGIRDELGDFTDYVAMTLNSEPDTYTLKNHKEVIVCGNTPLFRPFKQEREWFSYMKSEIDKSIECLTIGTRKSKAFLVENDRKAKELRRAIEAAEQGKPFILTTSILEELQTVDITDPSEIEKMQYLNSFYQAIEKREANDAGVDLDQIDKRAQVSTEEVKQYDDLTTENYLIMFEMRQKFVEEMAKNGLILEIIRNPIYFDEPTEKDVNTGEFEAQEEPEQEDATNEENNQTTGEAGNGE